jgi:hypothetical protein
MTQKRPDLDARGHPVNPVTDLDDGMSLGGFVPTRLQVTIHEDLHRQFKEHLNKLDLDPRLILTKLYYAACEEVGIDTSLYEDACGKKSNYHKRKHSVLPLHLSEVVLDECDLPGQCDNVEIGNLDPYYNTFVVRDVHESRSRHLARLQNEISQAANAIERLTSLKSYTGIFNQGRISKEEAKRELELILDLMPAEVGTALWGWCSLNDAITLVRSWKRQVVKQMRQQIEIEKLRISAESRAAFERKVDERIQHHKKRVLTVYGRAKAKRPQHTEEWPTWAGQMESYLDYASSPAMYNHTARWYKREVRDSQMQQQGDQFTLKLVHDECIVDLTKGLTNDNQTD